MPANQNIWFTIVNPYAGSGKTMHQWRRAETLMFKKNINYTAVTPENTAEAVRMIKQACADGFRRFIAVGGDGTVHLVLKALAEFCAASEAGPSPVSLNELRLAMLPIGSGNDWLRSHNIPKNHDIITDLVAADSFSPQDIARADIVSADDHSNILHSTYMANVGGYCFDANVCDRVNLQKASGKTSKLLYVKALLQIAFSQKTHPTKVVCDGRTVFDDHLYTISVGNGLYSGGGLCQTPSAKMNDGMLNMMVCPRFQVWRLPFLIGKLFNKKVEEIPFLHFFDAKDIWIFPGGQGQLVEVDGEVIGRAPVHFQVLDSQINVLHRD